MQLKNARIKNFRCLRDTIVDFDDLTIMIGANGTGKSSILHALDFFFHGDPLEAEDVFASGLGPIPEGLRSPALNF